MLTVCCLATCEGAKLGKKGSKNHPNQLAVGIDFTGCEVEPETGFCCIEKEEEVSSLQKDSILECVHKNIEKCHYTYVTTFESTQEEVCDETFEKSCQVTFSQQVFNETVKRCHTPVVKVCDGSGPKECKVAYESSCSTHYVEQQPGKFVGDTKCEKLPLNICGSGCVVEEGPEECYDQIVQSILDVPLETCDLNPQKICRFVTKLLPRLQPKPECTIIPQEHCQLKHSTPQQVTKPILTKWCQDPNSIEDEEKELDNEVQLLPLGIEPGVSVVLEPGLPVEILPNVPQPLLPPLPPPILPPPILVPSPLPLTLPPPPPTPQPQFQPAFQSPPPPPPPPLPTQQQLPTALYAAPPPTPRAGRNLINKVAPAGYNAPTNRRSKPRY